MNKRIELSKLYQSLLTNFYCIRRIRCIETHSMYFHSTYLIFVCCIGVFLYQDYFKLGNQLRAWYYVLLDEACLYVCLSLSPRLLLSSHQHRALVCLFWSGNLHSTVPTHQQIPLLLAKSSLSWHLVIPGFPQSDHSVGKPSVEAGSLCSDV